MINSVRNTVLSIISKDNNGYITPEEFNFFSKQAQMDVFRSYMIDYSNAIVKQNSRYHGSGYADLPKKIKDTIDTFVKVAPLTFSGGKFTLPSDCYFLDQYSLRYNTLFGIEKVDHNKILQLLQSPLTTPTIKYPSFILENKTDILIYPDTIQSNVTAKYVRYPLDPKWTYVAFSNGTPLFDQSAVDYQDFELPQSSENDLVIKILEYAGVSIREGELVQAAKAEELQNKSNQ